MGEWSVKTTTSEMIEAAITGQRSAQTALWSAHRRWLAAILIAHKPAWVDLEDLMQEVAVKFVSRVHTLRDPASFRPWLRRIAINAAREAARGPREIASGHGGDSEDRHSGEEFGRRDGRLTSFEACSSAEMPPPDNVTLREEAGGILAHALTLPVEFREPLILRSVHGIGCKQIAEILGLPVTTIETRLTRARRMLREEWLARTSADREAGPAPPPALPTVSVSESNSNSVPVALTQRPGRSPLLGERSPGAPAMSPSASGVGRAAVRMTSATAAAGPPPPGLGAVADPHRGPSEGGLA